MEDLKAGAPGNCRMANRVHPSRNERHDLKEIFVRPSSLFGKAETARVTVS
jgi:hypothetical protein